MTQKRVIVKKILMLGKTEDKRKRRCQRIRWLDSITDSKDMNLRKLRKLYVIYCIRIPYIYINCMCTPVIYCMTIPVFICLPIHGYLHCSLGTLSNVLWGLPGGTVVKNLPANAGDARDTGSILDLEDPLE